MNLYILRHAIAVMRGTEGYDRDSDRPLTGKGEKKIRRIAKGMLALGLEFDVIYTSPFVRAKQTADIVAEVFNVWDRLKLSDPLAADGDSEKLIDELNRDNRSTGSVLLIGHEPYLSEFTSMLLCGNRGASITLKKGGLCKLAVESLRYGKCATLEWLLTPRQMIQMGSG